MMSLFFDWILLSIALGGTAIAAWSDVKTTEVHDIIPLSMILGGTAVYIASGILSGVFSPLFLALVIGGIFLAFGYALYFTGVWGGADVFLLAAVGFLIPQPLAMFNPNLAAVSAWAYPMVFIFNLFLLGALYSIIYAFAVAVKTPKVWPAFFKDVKKHAKALLLILITITAAFGILLGGVSYFYGSSITVSTEGAYGALILLLILILALSLWHRFAKILEQTAFKRRIPVSKLRAGDMLGETIFIKGKKGKMKLSGKICVGLTAQQVAAIKKSKDFVWVRHGICYGPVFFITIVATWLLGNLLWILVFGI